MARDLRHVTSGIAAVIPNANRSSDHTVWVDSKHVAEALKQLDKLTGQEYYSPETFTHATGPHNDRVAIRLRTE